MNNCNFDPVTLTCPTCGYRAKRLPTYRQCRPVPPRQWKPVDVGAAVERVLTSAGITKERVERWTRTAGTPGGCGCAARKRWLTEKGYEVQRNAAAAYKAVQRFYLGE